MQHLSLTRWMEHRKLCCLRLASTLGRMRGTRVVLILVCVLLPRAGVAATWHVPVDAPTIQAGIDSAAAGDDVLVAPGTYFEHDITMRAGIWVHSEQGLSVTTVDASGAGVGFICVGLEEQSTIGGFSILNGHAHGTGQHDDSGGGIRSVGSRVGIRDCVISGCLADDEGGGIYAWNSDVEIEACRVVDCSADDVGGIMAYGSTVSILDCEILTNEAGGAVGGIYAFALNDLTIVRCVVAGNGAGWGGGGGISCSSPSLTIRDCLIIRNSTVVMGNGSGLYVAGSSGSVSGCTISGNDSGEEVSCVDVDNSDIEIDRTIVAFNIGVAFDCWDSQVAFHCCDVFGNTEGDDLCGTDLGGNFSADPLFCDANNNDYTLDCNSPCLPGNHPDGADCGLIGALGLGCGATPVEENSWGRIKSLYRR